MFLTGYSWLLSVTSGYLITTTGYFLLLLVPCFSDNRYYNFIFFSNYLRDYNYCLFKLLVINTFITIFGIYLTALIFSFNFTFYKIIYSRGLPIIKCNKLFGVKFENIFISISLKRDTCLWTLLLLNITPQSTDLMIFYYLQHLLSCSPKRNAHMEVDIQYWG